MDFLGLENKRILILGVANRKSVAHFAAKALLEAGAEPIFSVQDEARRDFVAKSFPGADCHLCDVAKPGDLERLSNAVRGRHGMIHGLLHSLAFANFSEGLKPFHETRREDFLQALDISCFSLLEAAKHFKSLLDPERGAIVTMSISTTRMASESYGYMAPIKAALDSSVCFLAKSLSADSKIRVNAVGAGLLKTSASAGIPGYVDAYLFAEQATLRKAALQTEEAANVAVFLLSPRSSGVNAQTVVVDAGMSVNYFDRSILAKATRP